MNIITPSEVLEHAFTHREIISPSVIRPTRITIAAERFIRPEFGDRLYHKFESGEHSMYQDEYLKPALAHYVRYLMIDELSIQLTDQGVWIFEKESRQIEQLKLSDSKNEETNSKKSLENAITTGENKIQSEKTDSQQKESEAKNLTSRIGEQSGTQTIEEIGLRTISESTDQNSTKESLKNSKEDTLINENLKIDGLVQDEYSYYDLNEASGTHRRGDNQKLEDTDRDTRRQSGTEEITSLKDSDVGSKIIARTDNNTDNESRATSSTESLTTNSTDNGTTTQNAKQSEERVGMQSQERDSRLTAEQQHSRTGERRDDDRTAANYHRMHPASDHQRNLIKARAMADAKILLGRAVRYLEHNHELFPDFAPATRMVNGAIF